MTNGPHTRMATYNRADIGGVNFRIKRIDDSWESTNSYFLLDSHAHVQTTDDFFVWVGQFQDFIEVVPPWEYMGHPRSTVMHFAVVRWCTSPSPAILPLSDLPLILRNEFLPWSCENGYKYAVWDLTHVVPTNVAIIDLNKHFAIGQCMHRGRRFTWKMLQAVMLQIGIGFLDIASPRGSVVPTKRQTACKGLQNRIELNKHLNVEAVGWERSEFKCCIV